MAAGNVALMKLGMSDDDYTYLSTDTDFIVHAAANVNLAYPYSVSTRAPFWNPKEDLV